MFSLANILLLLATSVVVLALLRRLKLPAIIGYLVVGLFMGPSGFAVLTDIHLIQELAEFGVVFLLFAIGLEFSISRMISMRWLVFGVGFAQVAVTTALFAVGSMWWGISWQAAVIVGAAFALSSTAIVTKQLTEQNELNTLHGRISVGILLFQDIAVVPLLILIPTFTDPGSTSIAMAMAIAFAKGAVIFAIMLTAGRYALRPLFHEVASAKSPELFTLTVLLIALFAGYIAHLGGLSMPLGAFLAGMMLAETEYRHQLESDIRPFKDILLGLFFVSVGLLIDVQIFADYWLEIIILTVALASIKTLIVVGITTIARNRLKIAVRSAILVAQGGEFGLLLVAVALQQNLLDSVTAQTVLSSLVISMALAPIFIRHNRWFGETLCPHSARPQGQQAEEQLKDLHQQLKDHTVILGFGRYGQNLAKFMSEENLPYVALDLDPERVKEVYQAGEPVFFGDGCNRQILEAAGIKDARLVVITFDDPNVTFKVLSHARHLNENIKVVVRTHDDTYMEAFYNKGAAAVIPESLEASLMFVAHAMSELDVPLVRMLRHISEARDDRYRSIRGFFHGHDHVSIDAGKRYLEQLHAVPLVENNYAVGKTISELNLEEHNVIVNAVRRGGIKGPQPEPDTLLRSGDVVILYGQPDALEKAENIILAGRG